MRDVAERLHRISDAERDGFDSYWLPQHFGADMLTVIAMAGQTHRIELGTAVVPTYPRHPVALAQQALTAQVAVGGRLTLGIGVSHRSTIEDWLETWPESQYYQDRRFLSVVFRWHCGFLVVYRLKLCRIVALLHEYRQHMECPNTL